MNGYLNERSHSRKPWWRLYPSSIAIGALLLSGFAVAILSAFIVDHELDYCWSHGWPWEFLRRLPDRSAQDEWLDPWALSSNVISLELAWLLADAALALGATTLVVVWLERRGRRGIRPWQFTLAQGIALLTAVAIGAAWWAAADR